MKTLSFYLRISEEIPGWIRGEQAEALAQVSLALPGAPIILQIGTFFGSAAVLLAGARKVMGSGKVYCVDPFDCSGDDFSVPHYKRLLAESGGGALRDHFDENIRRAGLAEWIEVRHGRAEDVVQTWTAPIDMLALGGDQSPTGARSAYECWSPFLKPGGMIAVHNSAPGQRPESHSGNQRIVAEEILPPTYGDIRLVVATTFARRAARYAVHALTEGQQDRKFDYEANYDSQRDQPAGELLASNADRSDSVVSPIGYGYATIEHNAD